MGRGKFGYIRRVLFTGAMENPNYGRKGSCFLQFLLFLILFIILLIWVYNMNFKLTF